MSLLLDSRACWLGLCLIALALPIRAQTSEELNPTLEEHSEVNVLVVYHSVKGHTRAMAEAVAEGAQKVPGAEVRLRTVAEAETEDLLWADAIAVGSPVYNANVTPEVQAFINSWPFRGKPLRNKIGGAFAAGGAISAGEEVVQLSILRSMLVFGMVVAVGSAWRSAFGASAITEEEPFEPGTVDERFLEKGRALGQRLAELASRLSESAISEPPPS